MNRMKYNQNQKTVKDRTPVPHSGIVVTKKHGMLSMDKFKMMEMVRTIEREGSNKYGD